MTYSPMKTVLIVEDADILRNLLHHSMREHFIILQAIDSNEALLMLSKFKPDACVLDIQLPGTIDGYSLCKIIKKQYPNLYIIMATGDEQTLIDNASNFAADDCVLKPYKTYEIIKKIKEGTQ